MENKHTFALLKSTLNGEFHEDNFVWGGAMNICWNTLSQQVIGEPLKLVVKDNLAKHMVENFDNAKFSKNDLSKDSYYTKAGYGQGTVIAINTQCRAKFPKKQFKDLQLELHDTDIISYAYFVKQVQYLNPFELHPKFTFDGKLVKGFKAKEKIHFDNIRVVKYTNDKEFTIKLLLKQKGEQLFIVKGSKNALPQEIVSQVLEHGNKGDEFRKSDKFEMPIVQLDIKRSYKQLVGSYVGNQKFTDYKIQQMYQNIKFKIDEVGAKVENQAVMFLTKGLIIPLEKPRMFIVDSSFWVVMKQQECHPYFVAQINNTKFMKLVVKKK